MSEIAHLKSEMYFRNTPGNFFRNKIETSSGWLMVE